MAYRMPIIRMYLANQAKNTQSWSPFPPLSEALLEIAREHGRVTLKIGVQLTGANRNTIKAHLKQLDQQGAFLQHGKRKGTWYTIR